MVSLIQRVRRDTVIWAAILVGHGLLLVIVLRTESRHSLQPQPDVSAAKSFIWLSLSPGLASKRREFSPTNDRAQSPSRPSVMPVPLDPVPQPAATTPQAIPRIDWFREGQVAAAAAATDARSNRPETFSPAPQGARKPCQPTKSSMEWKEPNFGMAGSDGGLRLPYVKLGKRCVLGLGFFGCDLGELPKPNGHLLDDMHDPNRSRVSVSAVDACEQQSP